MAITSTQRIGVRRLPASLVCTLFLAGGALNGFAVRIVEAWQSGSPLSPLLGLSPFEAIAVLIGAAFVLRAPERTVPQPGLPEILAAAALMIPSSAVSWAALAGYGLYVAFKGRDDLRRGALVFVLLAAAALWSSVILKAVALPVTTLEATIVGAVLAHFKTGVIVTGNVVGVPHEHSLILMTACSSADGLPKALVGLAALLMLSGGFETGQFLKRAAVVAIIYVVANLVRLTAMAWSADIYSIAHGPIGANVFDGLTVFAVIALALVGRGE